jgi:arabinan endo-1,5-alpha-L-arabinosidase
MRQLSRAFVVSCCLLAALPAAAEAVTLQAERGSLLRGDFVKRSGSVLLKGRATVSRRLRTPTLIRVQALARGKPCRGWPLMRISLDGRTVARVKVRSRSWRSYGRVRAVRRGVHKVVVRFLNPRRTRACRRALALDRITLTVRPTPPAPPPPPPAAPASAIPPGTFANPVYTGPAGGGFADPMVLKTAGGYWAYATGGLFHVASSPDLVSWTGRGSAMTSRPPWTDQTGEWNPWAPSVFERDEPCSPGDEGPCYVMYFVSVNRDVEPDVNCIGVATSTSPAGPFTDQEILEDDQQTVDQSGRPLGCGDDLGYSNIDPAPFVDEDGTPYLYFSTGHRCEEPVTPNAVCPWDRELSVVELAPDMLSAVGPRQPLLRNADPWEHGIVENPWPTKNGDTFELLYSGGFFTGDYAMGYATAAAPTEAFTRAPSNPLLAGNDAVRSPGGGMAATGPRGGPWAAYHGRAGSYNQPRTLRIDPLVRRADGALSITGPSSTPQPLP